MKFEHILWSVCSPLLVYTLWDTIIVNLHTTHLICEVGLQIQPLVAFAAFETLFMEDNALAQRSHFFHIIDPTVASFADIFMRSTKQTA